MTPSLKGMVNSIEIAVIVICVSAPSILSLPIINTFLLNTIHIPGAILGGTIAALTAWAKFINEWPDLLNLLGISKSTVNTDVSKVNQDVKIIEDAAPIVTNAQV